jgi:23S rRNA pseudouridine955/2504/2580 synthase
MRIDRWVCHRWPSMSYTALQRALRKGFIRLEGRRIQAQQRLTEGQEVGLFQTWLSAFMSHHGSSLPLSPSWRTHLAKSVLYEDDLLLVLNKPQGIAVQGGSNQRISLDVMVSQWRFPETIRLVHRLDKGTSGVFLMAKTLAVAQALSRSFSDHQVKKTYWAWVHGMPASQGRIQEKLLRIPTKVITSDAPEALAALTLYRRKATKYWKSLPFSWLELFPQSGRTHQVRVHLQHLGHPILGDALYGDPLKEMPCATEYPLLHCRAMSFRLGNRDYSFEAPPCSAFLEMAHHFTS